MIKHINAILWALTIFMVGSILVMDAQAADVQWSKGYDANCINPTERADGTPLPASEIASIKYHIYRAGTVANGNPEYEAPPMVGGCKATFINTKLMTIGDKEAYAITVDTDGRESVYSSPAFVFSVVKSNPKPPSSLSGILR